MVRLFSILPTFTGYKFGGLQTEVFALLALLAFCAARWMCSGFRFRISPSLASLFYRYAWLLVLVFCFAVAALRLQFFPLDESSLLKSPGLFSLSRYVQFAAVICGFLWLTNSLLRDKRRLEQAVNVYWWTGVVSCAYAVVSYFALRKLGISLLGGAYSFNEQTFSDAVRARGFFNEGGPFGTYVISVILIGLLRRHLTGKRIGFANVMICATAFVLSESRAAFLVVALLCMIAVLGAASFQKRVVFLVVAGGGILLAAVSMNIFVVLNAYLFSYQNLESRLDYVGEDPSLVLGRVAAAYIVPRMIEAHPLTGIGIGNYPLMRNDPRYRGQLPDIRYVEDLPGLGITGDAAELGIPATLLLVSLFIAPYGMCKTSASIVRICSLFQIFAHIMGVNLTFFYPWFVSACAIAASKAPSSAFKEVSRVRSFLRLMATAQNSPATS
jgi:hypothetical protein